MINVGDKVCWVDDPNRRGTVLKISDEPRRYDEHLPRMVFVEWDKTKNWEAPELLVRIEE